MSARIWFVTGTDTGVGKTHVAATLLRTARLRGLRCAAMKPAETGCQPGRLGEDAALLLEACGRLLDPEDLSPYRYREPVAPAVAHELRKQTYDPERIRAGLARLAADADFVLVEGAGGLLCPYPDNLSAADVAASLALPLLVVGRAGIGTVNHSLLTLAEARRRDLTIAGLVLSETTAVRDPSEHDNASLILGRGAPPFVATLPHGARTAEGLLERLLSDAEPDEHGG